MLKNKNHGFTLLEVMIALFVLSVGMLGSTSMILRSQTEATKTNSEAIAMQMSSNMAEMMRSNITAVEAGDYNALDSGAVAPGCISAGCNASQIATYDSSVWGWMLAEYLPDGEGTVRVETDATGKDSIFTITVNWTEIERTSTDTGKEVTKSHIMKFQP